ncbi:hypothetical protein [Paludifilum halophilum]|nr:hypothetical protein [Paludifilum halophilum]
MIAVHHVTYAEYEDSIDKRMEVEMTREANYRKARRTVAEAT